MHVVVVGAGSVGLTAVKWCLERGLEVTAFDRNDGCGGVWRQKAPPTHSPAYDSLFTNSSAKLMNLSDFAFPFKTSTAFPKHGEILRYFTAYMEHFGLEKWIHWNHTVSGIRKDEASGKWLVHTSHSEVGEEQDWEFDAVLVCTGKLWDPQLPDWVPQAKAVGIDVVHSKEYRNPAPYRGKRVVVVGVGNSALDIALELSLHDDVEVCISCRRGTTVIPTQDSGGNPVDVKLGSRWFQNMLPQKLRMLYILSLVQSVNAEFRRAGLPEPPTGLFGPQSPTSNLKQSQAFLRQLRKGRIKFVAGCAGVNAEGSVTLLDGSTVPADAVICCTGYRLRLDHLLHQDLSDDIMQQSSWDKDLSRSVSWLRLFKHIMYPRDPSLMFLGFITSFGNETCIGEMQARWATAVLAGLIPTPRPEVVQADLDTLEQFLARTKPSVSGFVRYVKYMDSLSEELGCKPYLGALVDPCAPLASAQLVGKVYFGPLTPAQFRLTGLDA
ncbi:Flavin-containing monooxygenase 5 (FMO 5) (Dimethylaniline monooxygenase [N-oxide-forming] 5) (Dimethylaniline oxidase 5) (Hepatic flavin-containing monooxygenase 5) (NAPDH oxidase), partial [Durusdinium trenchii]